MRYCGQCGLKNPVDNRFCAGCGAALMPARQPCPHCAAWNPAANRFCGHCGLQLQALGAAHEGQPLPATGTPAEEPTQPLHASLPTQRLHAPLPEHVMYMPPPKRGNRRAILLIAAIVAILGFIGVHSQTLPHIATPAPTVTHVKHRSAVHRTIPILPRQRIMRLVQSHLRAIKSKLSTQIARAKAGALSILKQAQRAIHRMASSLRTTSAHVSAHVMAAVRATIHRAMTAITHFVQTRIKAMPGLLEPTRIT